jgi:TPR repeat protein
VSCFRRIFAADLAQAHVALHGPWKDFLIEGWRAVQAGAIAAAWYRYLFAAALGYPLGSYNAAAVLAQAPSRSLVHSAPAVRRWLFAVSSQRGDKPAFRQLGLLMLRVTATCFPSSSARSIAAPFEEFVGCADSELQLLRYVFICLESAGSHDAESLHVLGQMYEHGVGVNASASLAIEVLLYMPVVSTKSYVNVSITLSHREPLETKDWWGAQLRLVRQL